jgi:hypothetical protein
MITLLPCLKKKWVSDMADALSRYMLETYPMRYHRPDLGFLLWRWRPTGDELPQFNAE